MCKLFFSNERAQVGFSLIVLRVRKTPALFGKKKSTYILIPKLFLGLIFMDALFLSGLELRRLTLFNPFKANQGYSRQN